MGLTKQQRSPVEGEFRFDIDETPLEETLTSFGGWPLFLRAARSLGVPASVPRTLLLKQRRRGLEAAAYRESFLALNALGGECLDDFDVLREDLGLASLLGYEPPSPAAARKFLYPFHDEEKIVAAQQQQLELPRAGIIPGESEALAGRAAVHRDVVGEWGRRCADPRIAGVDLEATIIESHQRQAQLTYLRKRKALAIASRCVTWGGLCARGQASGSPPARPSSTLRWRRSGGTGSRPVSWRGLVRRRVRWKHCPTGARTSWRRACCLGDDGGRTRLGCG